MNTVTLSEKNESLYILGSDVNSAWKLDMLDAGLTLEEVDEDQILVTRDEGGDVLTFPTPNNSSYNGTKLENLASLLYGLREQGIIHRSVTHAILPDCFAMHPLEIV